MGSHGKGPLNECVLFIYLFAKMQRTCTISTVSLVFNATGRQDRQTDVPHMKKAHLVTLGYCGLYKCSDLLTGDLWVTVFGRVYHLGM